MSNWESIVWFGVDDIDSSDKSGSDSGGSGVIPGIGLSTSYTVLTEFNEELCDEDDSEFSLEGM